MKREHESHIRRCFELAERGRKWTHPNPVVGCVIVKNGRVVGEGWHRKFGGPHAEVDALRKAGAKAGGATLYVNLEPCSYTGKTPPCVDAIIRAGVKSVVASVRDPNPLVSGAGFRRLRRAGIRITSGVLQHEARRLNERFFHFMETGLPFVSLKVAQTLDGRIADGLGKSRWITSEKSRAYGHALRAEHDAVLVGAGTVRKDNPELTVRLVTGNNPVRVVLDGNLSLSPSSRICRTTEARTVVITSTKAMRARLSKVVRLERAGVQVLGIESNKHSLNIVSVLKVLADLGIGSVLVEGGAGTVGSFLEARVSQRIYCFVAPKILGGGTPGLTISPRPIARPLRIMEVSTRRFDDDVLIEGKLQY